ncbi:AMP-binding enzyme [Streptomyces sp. G45]|uniref:AMP-binding enzyme n=1 Tax=Streptomyces sp. G45 TaxID=3406627 RepID=UPI003C1FF42D
MRVRVADGELLVALEHSPYVGAEPDGRYTDGWLHSRDAAEQDPVTGAITLRGRLDAQVSIGGQKVDLAEVERTVCELPGVIEAVAVYDGRIRVYAVLDGRGTARTTQELAVRRLAPYKRPRVHAVPELPRTRSGKLIRDPGTLRTLSGRNVPAGPVA